MEDLYYCEYCNKQYTNKISLSNHRRCCKNNPNRQDSAFIKYNKEIKNTGHKPWNYGLTKATDSRLATLGIASTPEKELARKNKISQTAKNNPACGGKRQGSGRGKKGWYKGYFCDSTYELVYIIYNLDHNIEFNRFTNFYEYEYAGKIHKYYPDFILADNSLVEIKGYYTDQVQAKLNSVKDRPIKLLMEADLKFAFDYVKENYEYKNLEDLYEK